jgi:hypothetical protein
MIATTEKGSLHQKVGRTITEFTVDVNNGEKRKNILRAHETRYR